MTMRQGMGKPKRKEVNAMDVNGKFLGYSTPEGDYCIKCSYEKNLKPSDECHPIGSDDLCSGNDKICDECGEVLR